MKKVLFIAKMNQSIQEINELLEEYYKVQFCSYNKPTIESMLKLSKPDIVLISMMGAVTLDNSVFSMIHSKYSSIPVLTIGNKAEVSRISAYLDMDQFNNLSRPVSSKEVLRTISSKLGDSMAGLGDVGSNDSDGQRRKLSTAERAAKLMDSLSDGKVGASSEGGSSDKGASTNEKKKVLVVDDNAGMLRTIKTILDDTYDIIVAPSGVKAMTMLGKKRPDVILLDYEMPVVDGRQTLEMIRGEEEFSSIPVLFLTGVNDREHIQSVIALHPAGYLLKPPVKETLIAAINKALKG